MKKIQIIALLFFISFLSLNFLTENSFDEHEKKLKTISKIYKYYDKSKKSNIVVSDSNKYKWTIALCVYQGEKVMGYHYERDSIFYSKADSSISLHGNKLYALYVSDIEAYYNYKQTNQPIGQTIVKETWNVEEVDSSKVNLLKLKNEYNGKWFAPTNVSQLFIMYKEKPNETNDEGWIYGIVDIDNRDAKPRILSNGKLSNCMSCHTGTKYDRMFGRFNK